MSVVKFLERQWVIRVFGLALLLSPAFNTLTTMSMLAPSEKKWTVGMFWKIMSFESMTIKTLYIAGLAIGIFMLFGQKSAWKWVMGLLGCHIIYQVLHLGENIRSNWASGLFFIINIAVFLFIADQLVWKQRGKNQPQSQPQGRGQALDQDQAHQAPAQRRQQSQAHSQASFASQRKVSIHFQGFGPWAHLVGISQQGIHVRCALSPPFDMGGKEIEVQMKNGPTLRTRLSHQKDQDFYFEYTRLSQEEIKELNRWLKRQQRAA